MDTDHVRLTGYERWRVLVRLNVSTTTTNDHLFLQGLADTLCELCLPAGTLERLAAELWEALLLMAAHTPKQSGRSILVQIYALAVEGPPLQSFQQGWGFFLIEKRGKASALDHPVSDQIEVYLYQERPEP